ncbi:MAG: hypothetical protein QMC23_09555 [Rubritalea sp.]
MITIIFGLAACAWEIDVISHHPQKPNATFTLALIFLLNISDDRGGSFFLPVKNRRQPPTTKDLLHIVYS